MHAYARAHTGHRTTFRTRFSLPTVFDLGIKLSLSDSVAIALAAEAPYKPFPSF